MKNAIPNGVYPTMITPFTKDNKIDYAAVEALINWYAEKKVDGIFAICQSSEIFFLSFEERLELLHFVMRHTPKNISVVASGSCRGRPRYADRAGESLYSGGHRCLCVHLEQIRG